MTIGLMATGSLFQIGDGAVPSEAFTTIPEVVRLNGPGIRKDYEEFTSHDSVGGYREWKPGFKDGDNVTAEINWRPSNVIHKQLREDDEDGTLRNFRIVYPDSSDNTVALQGFVTVTARRADAGQKLGSTIQIRITGPLSWS